MSAKLSANVREKLGSRPARVLRAQGQIPCNIQGAGKAEVNFTIDQREFLAARRHHEHLFDIEVAGVGEETALVRELQYDAFGDSILHVEFRRVVRGQELEAEVELEFVGHTTGGIPNHMVSHITIAAIPSKVPEMIEIHVDQLVPGEVFTAGQLELPEGVRLVIDPETAVANLATARSVSVDEGPEEGEEAASAGAEAAEPEKDSEG